MKKILLLFFAVIIHLSAFGQFTLTAGGMQSTENKEAKFIVIQCEGKEQQELFNIVLAYANRTYNSPHFVVDNVDKEMLTISAESEVGLGKALGMYDAIVDYKYKISIYFKDDRIRIDVPIISFPYEASNGARSRKVYLQGKTGMSSISIYNPEGKLREKEAKEKIESDINRIVTGIIQEVTNDAQEDW